MRVVATVARVGLILAIDCGTTNLKTALFDPALRRVAAAAAPVEYRIFTSEQVECDPEKIWPTLVALIRKVCGLAGIAPANIQTIVLGSQAQTFTILDPRGQPLIPFIGWPDKRPVAEAREITAQLGADFHRHCTFAPPVPQLTLAKLVWLRRRDPALVQKPNQVMLLPTYFAWRLAGLNITDPNLAAMGGLYSLARQTWWDDALRVAGVNTRQMSTLVDLGQAIPCRQADRELGLSPQLRIVLAGNDQTCGAVGNGVTENQLVLTLGTALVVYRHAGHQPGPYHPQGGWGPFPGGGYYELATRDEGCSALDWAIGQLLPGADPDTFRARGATAEPGAALFFPSRFGNDNAWSGSSDVAARARAVIEGISFSVRQLLEEGLDIPRGSVAVSATGGGSRSHGWLQLLADILNCRVQQGAGDALLGAARIATGRAGDSSAAGSGQSFTPDAAAAARYEQVFTRWRNV